MVTPAPARDYAHGGNGRRSCPLKLSRLLQCGVGNEASWQRGKPFSNDPAGMLESGQEFATDSGAYFSARFGQRAKHPERPSHGKLGVTEFQASVSAALIRNDEEHKPPELLRLYPSFLHNRAANRFT